MSAPKVSVVMPIYNVEKYLQKCLESVMGQTLRDIEIICVNDGSTDSSPDIVRKCASEDSRIIVIDKDNTGYGNSMNVGIDAASGEYIGVVETDDYIEPDMFEVLYNTAIKHGVDFVKSDHYKFVIDKNGQEVSQYFAIDPSGTHYDRVINPQNTLSTFGLIMMTWSGIYSTEFLRKNNIRHNETPGASFQDNGFWFQVFTKSDKCYFVNKAFYHLRRDNPNSSVHQRNKVYAMCTEYDFIEQYLKNNGLFEKYSDIYYAQRCQSYHFTLKRISHEYILEFLKRFSEDFTIPIEKSLLKKASLPSHIWKYTNEIVKDPVEYYCRKFYNPLIPGEHTELEKQYLVIINKTLSRTLSEIEQSKEYRIGKIIRFLPNLCHTYSVKKSNGVAHPLRLAVSDAFNVGPNKTPSIGYVASDNNRSSGAFISMSVLARTLVNEHNCRAIVYTPKSGTGSELLKEYKLREKRIDSYDWVVPRDIVYDSKIKARLLFESVFTGLQSVKLARDLCLNNIDIVHINTTYAYIGYFAARLARVPVVWHLREMLEEDQGRKIVLKNRAYGIIARSDDIIAISGTVFSKYQPFFKDKIKLIYNGVDPSSFIKTRSPLFSEKTVKMIFVGGLSERKGCFFLINALEKYYEASNRDFNIVFIGKSNDKFLKMIKNSPISDKITYVGFQKDVSKFYRNADVAFTCSDHEAFGRITVEAMMSGCLVIGSNSGCTPELIDDGVTGYLYQKKDCDSFCATLQKALSNYENARSIALAGQEISLKKFTSERNALQVKEVYDADLIHRKSVSSKLMRNLVVCALSVIVDIPVRTMFAIRKIVDDDSKKYIDSAKKHIKNGNYAEALLQLENVKRTPEAQYLLATLYLNGQGVAANRKKAIQYLKKSLEGGNADSGQLLLKVISTGEGLNVSKKDVKSIVKLADRGNRGCQIFLALFYQRVSSDIESAIRYARLAASDGDNKSMIILIDLLEKGDVENCKESFKLCEDLACRGHAGAQYRMYVKYMKGIGTSADSVQAMQYLVLSAENGYPKATERIKTIGMSFGRKQSI